MIACSVNRRCSAVGDHLLAGYLVPVRRMARVTFKGQLTFRPVGDEVIADGGPRHACAVAISNNPRKRVTDRLGALP